MVSSPPAFKIGDRVRFVTGRSNQVDRQAEGVVHAHEVYTDGNGTRRWYYVRWFSEDGKPDPEPQKFCEREIEAVEDE